jgi:peptide/nickel transport system substrate-binding protein
MLTNRSRSSLFSRRLNRRRALQAGTLAGAALATTLACGRSSGPSGSTKPGGSTSQPKKGGTLNHVGGSGPSGSYDISSTQLDPHINTPPAARGFRLVYQGLLGYDLRTYAVQPELAQKWEQASPTELVFHLQPGVKWQNKAPVNGRAMTADDVVFALDRMRTNDPKFFNRSLIENVDKIEAVDKATVRVTTKGPDASVLTYLSADPALVMAPEAVQKFSNFNTAESVIGTGAFVLNSLQDMVVAEYTRNPDFWKPGRPYLDGVRNRQFPDQSTAYAAFQAGQLDVLLLPGQETKAYIAKQGSGFTPDWFKDDTVFQPNIKTKPMSDARVTRALRLLIDHDEFLTGWVVDWYGQGRHGGVLPLALDGWDFSHDEYSQMLEWKKPKDDAAKEALSLLSAAGYTKDNPLSFEISGGNQSFATAASQLLQGQWAKLGQGAVKATIKEYDQPGQNTIRANRSFALFVGGNSAAFPEPDAYFNTLYATGASRNYTGFSDPTFDAMAQKQRTILDSGQRHAFVKDMVKYLIDNGPSTMLVNRYFLNGVQPKVRDYAPEFFINGRQYEWIWMSA